LLPLDGTTCRLKQADEESCVGGVYGWSRSDNDRA
jgi:hypothetical protein